MKTRIEVGMQKSRRQKLRPKKLLSLHTQFVHCPFLNQPPFLDLHCQSNKLCHGVLRNDPKDCVKRSIESNLGLGRNESRYQTVNIGALKK